MSHSLLLYSNLLKVKHSGNGLFSEHYCKEYHYGRAITGTLMEWNCISLPLQQVDMLSSTINAQLISYNDNFLHVIYEYTVCV